jgi:hypothetical protein
MACQSILIRLLYILPRNIYVLRASMERCRFRNCVCVMCLECGCHQPADSHGRDDVTTAELVTEK